MLASVIGSSLIVALANAFQLLELFSYTFGLVFQQHAGISCNIEFHIF